MPNSKQLTELHNKFLIDLISYYRNKSQRRERTKLSREDTLKQAFDSILNNEYFKSTLEWFVIWEKKHDESIDLSFLVGGTVRSRRIIGLYTHRDYSKHFFNFVTTFSVFCSKYKQPDTSFIISATPYRFDIGEPFYRHFVLLNFEDIAKMRINKINDDTEIKPSNVIEMLKKQYDILKNKIKQDNNFKQSIEANVVNPISGAFDTTISDEDEIVKFINSFCWLKLAHSEDWKMMIYFPGIISKEFEDVPLGVNIGLKEVVPDNIVFFLNTVTLLFCTRESVDFFERKVQKERDLRMAMFREVYHDIGRIIMPSIIKATRQSQKYSAIWLLEYLRDRLELLRSLSIEEKKNKGDSWPIRKRINDIFNKLSLERKNKLELSFSGDEHCELYVHLPSFDLIIENLISNSGRHGGRSRKIKSVPINIKVSENDDDILIEYIDYGSGFKEHEKENVNRWTKGIFEDDEVANDKGVGFSMIQKTCSLIGARFWINWGDKINGRYKPKFNFIFPKGVIG